jgi:hypothetical protein
LILNPVDLIARGEPTPDRPDHYGFGRRDERWHLVLPDEVKTELVENPARERGGFSMRRQKD